MTDEEINRKFDVVAGILADLAVRQQKADERADERMSRLEEVQSRAEERWTRTEESIRALLAVSEIQSQEIRELGEAVRTIDERGRQTDDRLNALINTVERYISERRNGKADGR
jgi:chromosome segregation ATPase